MIFFNKKLIITTLTNHIKLSEVSKKITDMNLIIKKIKSLVKTLENDFNIVKPKILISGLNPHSGENNKIGNEESKYLIPIIRKIKKLKINIEGPIPGDSMFSKVNLKQYDCFICCYHDQALIPFKILTDLNGINYTGGLDIIRVSPDHGTAYDIVGKNVANTESVLNCFKTIKLISKIEV